jgi:hypothetical protein
MIDLNPRTLPVHVRRSGQRIGWVRVLRDRRPGRITFTAGHKVRDLVTGTVTHPRYIHCEMIWIDDVFVVQTDETRISEWNKVRGFIEDRGRDIAATTDELVDNDSRAH